VDRPTSGTSRTCGPRIDSWAKVAPCHGDGPETVEPVRSKSLETTASWPSAPQAEIEKTAAINQAQRLIICPPAVALDADCERYRGVSARYRSLPDMRTRWRCAILRGFSSRGLLWRSEFLPNFALRLERREVRRLCQAEDRIDET
jgi:hypothetical protein